MVAQYRCKNEVRRQAVREQSAINGIDYLELSTSDQKTLTVHFIHNLPGQANPVSPGPALTSGNLLVDGGVRIKGIRVLSVASAANLLTVKVNAAGDFSMYTLRLVISPDKPDPPSWNDPQLSAIDFSFKARCPSEFDCKPATVCATPVSAEPAINYLAKDYASFRRLMLDRMALVLPDWAERDPADLGIALVETLAYAADHLSYYQDAVATEAYLGTARKRISVRRHARLLDYQLNEGANARAWVAFQVDLGADGSNIPAGKQLSTKFDAPGTEIAEIGLAVNAGALVFETLTNVTLWAAHNRIEFYTWSDLGCCLPKGSTRATLNLDYPNLHEQDVLILEEVLDPATGESTPDPKHRHAVRLTKVVRPLTDPLNGAPITEIEWAAGDALPFPLCVSSGTKLNPTANISVARGNVVLADHGQTILHEHLDALPANMPYRPQLKYGPLTQQRMMTDAARQMVPVDITAPATAAFEWDINRTRPAVTLQGDGNTWLVQPDLLESSRFDSDFVVETEDDGTSHLRFGDNVLGKTPANAAALVASYRVGSGSAGNVGAEAIAHIVNQTGITMVRNPLPAQGGTDPESIEDVRLYAPQAFRVQQRAVTVADYASIAQRHPEIQQAVATLQWTGSWHTVFVTVDRKGSEQVDDDFKNEIRSFFEQFRLAGYDLEIEAPVFVPLDIGMNICVSRGYLLSDVEAILLELFSSVDLAGGRRGFFHPDNLTFGQPVYLSQVIAGAMQVPGVNQVDVSRFQRWHKSPQGELQAGKIAMARLEIARLDNDANHAENGKIEFTMRGGI